MSRFSEKRNEQSQFDLSQHDRIIHALALSLFSDSGIESGVILTELYNWTYPRNNQQKIPPSPIIITSLVKFINLHFNQWKDGPSSEAALVALSILFNFINTIDPEQNLKNSIMIASSPDVLNLFFKISHLPNSSLFSQVAHYFPLIAKYSDLSFVFGYPSNFVSQICSSFMICDPSTEEVQIRLFLMFSLLPDNFKIFISELGVNNITKRLSMVLDYPSLSLQELILEVIYTLAIKNPDFKDSVCSSPSLLRNILLLAIPPYQPYTISLHKKQSIPISPSQKACTLLLELADDSRVVSYLAHYKKQITSSMMKWESKILPELALKVANASVEVSND